MRLQREAVSYSPQFSVATKVAVFSVATKVAVGWEFPKSTDFYVIAGAHTLSGRIFAESPVPEMKSGFKFSSAALVSGTNLRSIRKN